MSLYGSYKTIQYVSFFIITLGIRIKFNIHTWIFIIFGRVNSWISPLLLIKKPFARQTIIHIIIGTVPKCRNSFKDVIN